MQSGDIVVNIDHEMAVADCKYAKSLGDLALIEHFKHWLDINAICEYLEDIQYQAAIREIKNKLGTEECLLK